MKTISRILVEKKTVIFLSLVVITLGISYFSQNLGMDNSLEVWFLKDDPALARYDEFKTIYGNDEVIAAWIRPSEGIYEKKFVKKLFEVSHTLEEHKLIKRVLSITAAPYVEGRGGVLQVEDLVNKKPGKGYSSKALKDRLMSNPVWEKLLLNRDESAVILVVEPEISENMDAKRPAILQFVRDSLDGLQYKLAGVGVMYQELNDISMKDSPLFTMLSYVILIGALIFFIRKWAVLRATTIVVILSLLLFLGIAGIFHLKFNMISAILPSLIVILCIADIVHIFSYYFKTDPGEDRLKRTLSYVLVPCLFTTLTTAMGFMALSSSPMKVLKDFGIFSAIGVLVAYVVTVIVSSFVLGRTQEKKEELKAEKKEDVFDRFLGKVFSFNMKNYKIVAVTGLLLIAVAVTGVFKLDVDTFSMNFLLEDNKIRQNSEFFEKDYGYYTPLEIRIKPKSEAGVKDPVFLKKLSLLQEKIEKDKDFQKTTSLADVVKLLNKALNDDNREKYTIPDTRNAVAQELLLYEIDADNDLSYFTDSAYSEVRLTARIPMVSSRNFKKIIDKSTKMIHEVYGDSVQVLYGGYIPLYVIMMDYVTSSQIRSFLIAFLIIFAIMAFLFRSLSVILIGVVPNILPVFLTLGFMGWTGINLDIATVTIAAIAIGISVDDTIHFIFSYKRKKNEGADTETAVSHTLNTTGKAIIITSLLLVLGYSVFVFAHVKSVIYMGLLIAVTMISALLADLLLLPSLLFLFNRKKR